MCGCEGIARVSQKYVLFCANRKCSEFPPSFDVWDMVQYCVCVLYCSVGYGTVLCVCVVLQCGIWYSTVCVLYCSVGYGTVLCVCVVYNCVIY
jgi:hypothetical protein